jgi:hypothetical protein
MQQQPSLVEVLRDFLTGAAEVAVFQSLLGIAHLERLVVGVPPELLEEIRSPLCDLWELFRDAEKTWAAEDRWEREERYLAGEDDAA